MDKLQRMLDQKDACMQKTPICKKESFSNCDGKTTDTYGDIV
jgi:hypothetical protein